MFRWIFCFVGLGLVLLPPVAHAQAVDVPRNVEAGSIEEQMKPRQEPPAPMIGEKAYQPMPMPEGVESVRLVLKELVIEGAERYPPERFRPFYEGLIGKDISLAEVYKVADRIRRVYHEDGYILTQVFLPEQEIRSGQVRIRVTEGFVSRLRWQGDAIAHPLISRMAEEITRSRPFSSNVLEDVMLRLNEIPGITARAALEPLPAAEAEVGAVGLVISVERRRMAGSLGVDNYSSRYLGVWQSTLRSEGYGLFHGLDKLSFTGSSSADPARLVYTALDYRLPVHASGTTIFIGGNFSATHPGFSLAVLDIFSRAKSLNAGVTQPLLRSRTQSLDLTGEFNWRNQYTEVFDQRFSEDRIRTAALSTRYSLLDSWGGANMFEVAISKGLDILSATETGSPMLSRANGRSDFTKLVFNASRLQTLSEEVSLLVAVTGQRTSASLLSSEQFGIGGIAFGRAYDSSELSGDEGAAASAELRWQTSIGSWAVQPFAFYDIGEVRNKEPGAETTSLASTGIGARIQWHSARLDTSVALPLTLTPGTPKLGAEHKNPRFNGSLTVSF